MRKSRFLPARRALIFWTLFIDVGAVCGAVGTLADPTGKALDMDTLLPYFQKLPLADLLYRDYRFPGIALLLARKQSGCQRLLPGGQISDLSGTAEEAPFMKELDTHALRFQNASLAHIGSMLSIINPLQGGSRDSFRPVFL